MHPKYKIERKYIVHTKLNINKNKLKLITNGVLLENGQKVKANINCLEKNLIGLYLKLFYLRVKIGRLKIFLNSLIQS